MYKYNTKFVPRKSEIYNTILVYITYNIKHIGN